MHLDSEVQLVTLHEVTRLHLRPTQEQNEGISALLLHHQYEHEDHNISMSSGGSSSSRSVQPHGRVVLTDDAHSLLLQVVLDVSWRPV